MAGNAGRLLCVACAAGCYHTSELTPGVPAPGTRIVAGLTPAGTVQMERWIGADALTVEGRIVEARPDGWELEVLRVEHRGPVSVQWRGERIAFPPAELRNLRQRRLDGVRTGIFGLRLAGALYLLARDFMDVSASGSGAGPPPAPPQ